MYWLFFFRIFFLFYFTKYDLWRRTREIICPMKYFKYLFLWILVFNVFFCISQQLQTVRRVSSLEVMKVSRTNDHLLILERKTLYSFIYVSLISFVYLFSCCYWHVIKNYAVRLRELYFQLPTLTELFNFEINTAMFNSH